MGHREAVAISFVALGDSTTCGLGDRLPDGRWRGFVPLLAAAFGQDTAYVNLAVSGARAADVRYRQLPTAISARPDLVSLIVGVNDTMRSDFNTAQIRGDILATASSVAVRRSMASSLTWRAIRGRTAGRAGASTGCIRPSSAIGGWRGRSPVISCRGQQRCSRRRRLPALADAPVGGGR